jgi:anaphase-promoting complex subunit 4
VDKILQLKADLPRELSNIDIETSLPKLATLPPTGVGADDDVFSSRGSVDVIFHGGASNASTGGAGGVDALVVATAGGQEQGRCEVHLRIFDSFEIGTVDIGSVLPAGKGSSSANVIKMASHPFLPTVFLITELSPLSRSAGEATLHLLALDLSFIPQTGRNLPLVARKATQLGNLLRYISQVQTQLVAEIKAAFDLPTRFLRNVNESLAEGDENADFVYAAHHLAVTGDCDPKLKEWLVDEVGERGLKRWEKAVGDCLEVVRRMTSECLLPALERCLVVLSRLDGLARFPGTSSRLGLDEKSITKVRETVDAMGILAEDLLLDVGVEMREFLCFMKWLKWECEVEALEEGSERAEELRETWTGETELKTVLAYVGGALKESRLKKYLIKDGAATPISATASFDDDPEVGFYTEFTRRRAAVGSKDRKMPTLRDMVERLQKQSETVFAQIAETFRKSILTTYLLQVPAGFDAAMLDATIIPAEDDETLFRLFAVSKDMQDERSLRCMGVNLPQGKGVKPTMTSDLLTLPDVKGILDARFVDDKSFLILAETASDVRIFSQEMLAAIASGAQFEVKHVFEQSSMNTSLNPARMEVNGLEGRRVVAVLDKQGLGYMVFDLDADEGNEDSIMAG